MIHMKKPAPYSPTRETIDIVCIRDDFTCQYCGAPAQGKPHHWGLHNTKANRAKYPMLVHHHANLVCVCQKCHTLNGSGDNLPEYRAGAIELVLATGGKCYLQIEEDGSFNIGTIPLAKPD